MAKYRALGADEAPAKVTWWTVTDLPEPVRGAVHTRDGVVMMVTLAVAAVFGWLFWLSRSEETRTHIRP